jgi:outer membrane protein assembly factor BamB
MRTAALLLLFVSSALADWPQWRGPARDGQVPDALDAWPAELRRAWSVEVGEGHSSPVIAGDSVYVFTRENGAETLRRLVLADGEEAWKTSYAVTYEPMSVAAPHGKGPKSTPAIADGRICTLGVTGVLSCHQASDGQLLWRKDFAGAFPNRYPLYGAAMSPLFYNGLLLAHVGGDGGGALIAFDPATGAEKWRWSEDGPGYSSPVIVRAGGRDQLVTQTEQHIVAVDPENGKTLWTLPFSTPYKQNSVTPVVFDDLVVFGGTRQPSFAVRLGAGAPQKVWESTDATLYMSSPVRVGDRLCGFTEKLRGALYCMDPQTGKVLWMSGGRLGSNALVMAAGDRLVASTSEAELIVVPAAGAEYKPERIYKVADSNVWAHPAISGDRLLIKDLEGLTLWRLR